mmetsp:Transcript_24358/g.72621  ORF Transcript_24358/g.72621 Transcript_24358/m.72621 type:complete len:86 (+) Transcript_24358:93-350(+)
MGQSLPAAEGWLYKRHEHKPAWGKQWAKRYVTLNAKRGTLAIGKNATAEPSTAVPLCDVSLVKRVEGANVDWSDNVFEVHSAAET